MKLNKELCQRCRTRFGRIWLDVAFCTIDDNLISDDEIWDRCHAVWCLHALEGSPELYVWERISTTDFPPTWCIFAVEHIANYEAEESQYQ